ncbi:hypothetical protein ZTR_06642 [Talaromyces verruculosus]|nr:hypothetical protein ZTR_06642 [Talaromyces verruculosus]
MAFSSSKKLEHEQQRYGQNTEQYQPPPPTYSAQQQQQPQGNNDTTSKYPPQAHHTQSPALTLQTENTKLLGTALRIYDLTNPATDIFNVKVNPWSMNLTFLRPDTKQEFASVKFHKLSMKMDVSLPDTPTFTMGFKMKLIYEVSYPSPALGGQMATWKTNYHFKTIDFEWRENSSGVMLARIKASNFKWKKMSQIEFFGDACNDKRLVEEVVVTGAAILEYVLVMNATAVAVA